MVERRAATTSTPSTCASTAGRSAPHQTPNYVTDLRSTTPTSTRPGAGSPSATATTTSCVSAHSTGGLTPPLWADDRQPAELAGMVLNSPWFDLQGTVLIRTAGTRGRSTRSAPGSRCARSRARSAASTPAACTATTRASGTSTSPGSRWSRGRCTPDGCARSGGATPGSTRARRAVPGPGAVVGRQRRTRARWATTCTATTSCSTSPRSGGGRPRSAGTSPTSPSRAPATTSCSPAPRPGRRGTTELDRWVSAYVD